MATGVHPGLRRNPEAVAWLVIWAAFAIFCLLCIGSFFGLNWYRDNATQSNEARLDSVIDGTLAGQGAGKTEWVVLDSEAILREGDSIRTDRTGRGLVVLFDGSTVLLYPDTELQVSQLRLAVFTRSSRVVSVAVKRGRAVIAVARPSEGRTDFTLTVPQGRANLLEGSYSVVVSDSATTIKVRERGRGFVTGSGRTVEIRERERTDLIPGPTDARPAGIDLVQNGDFHRGLTNWIQPEIDNFCTRSTAATPRITSAGDLGRPAIRFFRSSSNNTPCEVRIRQEVSQDVTEFWTLRLSAELYLVNQSVPGGGVFGSEYPVMIRVHYRSIEGLEDAVLRGFYYQNDGANRIDNGVPVRRGEWVTFNFEEDLMSRPIRPRQILAVEVIASGHDYESLIGRVSLIGE